MLNRPHGADLLHVARTLLLDEIAHSLKGQPRYVALMVANAMGIAAREFEHQANVARAQDALAACTGSVDTSMADLVSAVRAGRWDGDASLHRALSENVKLAAIIWKPVAAKRG